MRASILLLACIAVAVGTGYDTDGDGLSDWSSSVLVDEDGDGTFDMPHRPASSPRPGDSLHFVKAWDSGTILNNQWDADCGFLDDDTLLDLLGHTWNPNKLHVFESDGAGGYDYVWSQTESMPPASYGALAHGDPDCDGRVEILGGDVSTLGKVVLFENVADDSWAQPHVLFQTRLRLRAIRVADTDQDDTAEIILVCGNTDGGKVLIYEHTGPPGIHNYELRYEYTTVSYVFNGSVGDADNDGYPEVLLGIGGGHGYPMYMRRIVYDPGTGTYSHHMYEHPTVTGLHLTPLVCDVDRSGDNELIVGSSGGPVGQFHVFKNVGGDTFQPLWTSNMTTDGNVISVAGGTFAGFDNPLILAAPFDGAVYGYIKDDTAFHGVSYFFTGNPIRSLDISHDRLPAAAPTGQLVLAESGLNQMTVWRPDPPRESRVRLLSAGTYCTLDPTRPAGR